MCCLALQTKEGKPARGVTAEEFKKEVLPAIMQAAQEKGLRQASYCFDNASVHKRAINLMEQAGEQKIVKKFMRIPAWPPDFNKVIEHSHAILQEAFFKALASSAVPAAIKGPGLRQLLSDTFFRAITKRPIAADVDTMKDTYKAVIAAKGDYPPPKFR